MAPYNIRMEPLMRALCGIESVSVPLDVMAAFKTRKAQSIAACDKIAMLDRLRAGRHTGNEEG
jgi:hypothetical protein